MYSISDTIKRALLRLGRLQRTLEKLKILSYQDKVRLRRSGYQRQILFGQNGNNRIADLIMQNKPLMISRLGSVELKCIRFFLEKRQQCKQAYPDRIKVEMFNNAGFFPADDESLDAFAELYLKEIGQIDLMGIWFNVYENTVCNSYCPNTELADFDCLEPFRFSNPWSGRLSGKKVLVVHPFVESIRKQYHEKRRLLFTDPDVLPAFEMTTIKAVQSIAGSKVDFPTWFDAYYHMCDEIVNVDFDVCIIGAGAYGLPLASFVKKMGKQAIHMGGVTQILFGIMGRRWEQLYADSTAKLFNEHWVRPLSTESPENRDHVEKGCYW